MVTAAEIAASSIARSNGGWSTGWGWSRRTGRQWMQARGITSGRRWRSGSRAGSIARRAVSGRSGGRGAAPAALVVVMSLPAGWIAVAAVLALLLGLWLMLAGRGMRRRRGLGGGKTVSLDRVTLTSRAAGPDRQAGPAHQNGWHDHRRGMEIIIAMHLIPWVGG